MKSRWLKLCLLALTLPVLATCTLPKRDELTAGCPELPGFDVKAATPAVLKDQGVVLLGSRAFLCPCYAIQQSRSRLFGSGEGRGLLGDSENSRLLGAQEGRDLLGSSENRNLLGAQEGRDLLGRSENRNLLGAQEGNALLGASENTNLLGGQERGKLMGADAGLQCRIEPSCRGFRLLGTSADKADLLTASGRTQSPASCVTW